MARKKGKKKSKIADTRTDEEKRSYTMSRVRGTGTAIEVMLQKALWHRGVRYRKNYRKAPGSPDIAITKHRIAVFCDGEFWHGKDWEAKKACLKNNRDYWIKKIEGNIERDSRTDRELIEQGWHVLRFWESEIKADIDACVDAVIKLIQSVDNKTLYPDFSSSESAGLLMVAEQQDEGYPEKAILQAGEGAGCGDAKQVDSGYMEE